MWLLAFFAFFNRAASIYVFISCALLGVLSEILKVYYSDGRPFYMVPGIKALDCNHVDFGRPDGHLFSTATVLVMIFVSYFDPHDIRGSAELLYRNRDGTFDDADRKDSQHNHNRSSPIIFFVFGSLLGLVILLGWFSEIMTGSNSLDQVLFGSSLSIGFTLVWYLLRDELQKYYL